MIYHDNEAAHYEAWAGFTSEPEPDDTEHRCCSCQRLLYPHESASALRLICEACFETDPYAGLDGARQIHAQDVELGY